MNTLALDGLDGTNPLHVLAALGAFALTHDLDPGATLAWARAGGAYAPRITTTLARDAWCDALGVRVRAMGMVTASEDSAPLRVKVRDLGASLKKRKEALKKLRGELKAEIKAQKLTGDAKRAHGRERLEPLERLLDAETKERAAAQVALAASMGFGPAHLGDAIGVAAEIYRLHARHALERDPVSARQLAALASDACVNADGNIEPTPFSFSNGGSGKLLLKDFRALALACTRTELEASLFAGEPAGADMTSLNWDPRDCRSYAHQWADPAAMEARTDVAANALAYVGLGLLPCFPGRRGLEATAMLRDEAGKRAFTWPLWSPALRLPLVRALLASASARGFAADADEARARGVLTVQRAQIVNPTGKRNFFGPAEPARG
jgi:hypothetical protein